MRRRLPRPFKKSPWPELRRLTKAIEALDGGLEDASEVTPEIEGLARVVEAELRFSVTSLKVRYALIGHRAKIDDAETFEQRERERQGEMDHRLLEGLAPIFAGAILDGCQGSGPSMVAHTNGRLQVTRLEYKLRDFRGAEDLLSSIETAINAAVNCTKARIEKAARFPEDEKEDENEMPEIEPKPLYIGDAIIWVLDLLSGYPPYPLEDETPPGLLREAINILLYDDQILFAMGELAHYMEEFLKWPEVPREGRIIVDGASSLFRYHFHNPDPTIGDAKVEQRKTVKALLDEAEADVQERRRREWEPKTSLAPPRWLLEQHEAAEFTGRSGAVRVVIRGDHTIARVTAGEIRLHALAEAVREAYNRASQEAEKRLQFLNMSRLAM